MAKKKNSKIGPKRPVRSKTGTAEQVRSVENTTVADLLNTLTPPRADTTGAHVVAAGQNYLIVIQGPESRFLTARVLEFLETLHEAGELAAARGRDD